MNVWDALNLYKEGGSSSVGKKKTKEKILPSIINVK